jgi:hypothetical protein
MTSFERFPDRLAPDFSQKVLIIVVSTLTAGFAVVDITPPQGDAQSFTIFDPITLKALVLQQGSQSVALLAADLFVIDAVFQDGLRERLADCSDLDVDWILPGALHHGTGPTFFSSYVNQPTEALKQFGRDEFYMDRAVDCIRQAVERSEPVRVAGGMGEIHGMSYNRRAHDADGSLHMVSLTQYPTPPEHLAYGNVDPHVGVLRVESLDETRQVALFSFGCHALALWDDRGNISGDWPAQSVDLLKKSGIDGLFFQGALGNVHPIRKSRQPARRIGHGVAGAVLSVFHRLCPRDDVSLERIEKTIELPLAPQPDVAATKTAWEQTPANAEGLQRYQYWMAERYHDVENAPYRLRGVRLGDTMLLHMPGELFAETGAAIREAAGAHRNLLILCNACPEYGYVPTAEAHAEGGDEPLFAPLDRDAEAIIRSAAIDLINEAFSDEVARTS